MYTYMICIASVDVVQGKWLMISVVFRGRSLAYCGQEKPAVAAQRAGDGGALRQVGDGEKGVRIEDIRVKEPL